MIGFGRPRVEAGVSAGGEFARRARRDTSIPLGLHDEGLVTEVNGFERGLAERYSPDLVSRRQAESVSALSWLADGASVYVDTYELGGIAWVYFVGRDGGYFKVALTDDGGFVGLGRCEANRWSPPDEDFVGEFEATPDGGYWWSQVAARVAHTLPRT
jgi:hypothetical protein